MSVRTAAAYDARVDPHSDTARPLSALPSVRARALAFLAIVIAGVAGGLIGYAFIKLQCHGNCTTPDGLGAVTGGALAAGGVAIVAVLTLRAMGEWHTIKAEREAEAQRAAQELLQPQVPEMPETPDLPPTTSPLEPPDTAD
jgi:hypothetical protein